MAIIKDMTEGNVTKSIIRFALPLLLGNILQQTYNIVDTIIVGKCLGDDALAAVGATGSITYLFYTLCIGLSIGAGIIISQYFGAGEKKSVRKAISNSAIVTAVFGIVISLLSVFLAKPVLSLLGVPEKLLEQSAEYMKIACSGTICVAAYNWINSVMRALGNSVTPLIFLGVATVINVVLDLLFVVYFGMGVGGAAFATVLSQGISAFGCIVYCFKSNRELRPKGRELRPEFPLIKRCVMTGIPIAMQNGLISISMVALQSVTNSFGSTIMAAYTVSMRVEQFVQQPFSSINAAMSTFTGQNIGAGKEKRAVDGLKVGLKISSVFAVIVFLLFAVFGKSILGIFVSGSDVISVGYKALLITGIFYIPLGAIHTVRGFLNGAGDTGYALVNGFAEVVCRVGFSLILTRISFIGFWGIWITTSITWIVTALVSIIRYFGGKWRMKSLITKKQSSS